MDRPEFLSRGGSVINHSKRKVSSFFVVMGLVVMALALNARAQTPAHSTRTSSRTQPDTANAPWYPSLEAFEHYNSGRSHVFSMARFRGSLRRHNNVDL